MVAYSFKPFFAPQIVLRLKRQTVRSDRPRHARPGEPVQLYQGMRTKHCRKILDRDPVCVDTLPIIIETSNLLPCFIASIEVGGCMLHRDEIETFASDDGFEPKHINGLAPGMSGKTARENMGAFWRASHAPGCFSGVVIKWSDPA